MGRVRRRSSYLLGSCRLAPQPPPSLAFRSGPVTRTRHGEKYHIRRWAGENEAQGHSHQRYMARVTLLYVACNQ